MQTVHPAASADMDKPSKKYSGTENLEVMAEARRYNEYLLSLVLAYKGGADKLVDFGAGAGTFTQPLHELGHDIVAVEPDNELRETISSRGIPAVASLDALQDNSLSFVYTLNVLEHIEDDLTILKLLRRKLCPGGSVLIYVPAFQVLFTSMDRKVGHLRRYTRAQLRQRLTEAGLEVEELRYVDFMGFFATLFFKLFDRGEGTINKRALILFDRVVFPVSLVLDKIFSSVLGKNVLAVARRTT